MRKVSSLAVFVALRCAWMSGITVAKCPILQVPPSQHRFGGTPSKLLFRICRLFSERASDLSKSYCGRVGCIRISRPERLHIAKRFAVKCEDCQ
ncbi:hypothetical protein B0H14DRAFT_1191228 [Mycena olivaceomarginata]|nr:hypothetical protein B0H14DRAFT_1191228 [Mycena olivaceomarginata]